MSTMIKELMWQRNHHSVFPFFSHLLAIIFFLLDLFQILSVGKKLNTWHALVLLSGKDYEEIYTALGSRNDGPLWTAGCCVTY